MYKYQNNPVSWPTWIRHVEHHMKTLYGNSCRDVGLDMCELHNKHYAMWSTLGGTLEFVRWWGEKYGLDALREPTLPDPFPMKAKVPGLYLKLFHGRDYPDQELGDWGKEGPAIGPLHYVQGTYMSELKYCFADHHPEFQSLDEEGYLSTYEDMIELDGMYYGDWSVFYVVEEELMK